MSARVPLSESNPLISSCNLRRLFWSESYKLRARWSANEVESDSSNQTNRFCHYLLSLFFFPFLKWNQRSNLHKQHMSCIRSWRSSTTQIPPVIACKAVRQGSTTLIIEKFRVDLTSRYKKIDAIRRGQTCWLEGSNSCSCSHSSNERGLQFIVVVACGLQIDVVHSRRGLVREQGCGWVQHSILYWASLSRDTSTLLWLRMCVSVHSPPWHIREEKMSEQCSVAKLTAGRWHKICTRIRTPLRKQTQRLSSTEGFANNDLNKWPLRVSW